MAARKRPPNKRPPNKSPARGEVRKAKEKPPKRTPAKGKKRSKIPPRLHEGEEGNNNILVNVFQNGTLIHTISATNLDDRRFVVSSDSQIINKPRGQSYIGFARALLQRLI